MQAKVRVSVKDSDPKMFGFLDIELVAENTEELALLQSVSSRHIEKIDLESGDAVVELGAVSTDSGSIGLELILPRD